jgi:hypothetical protein
MRIPGTFYLSHVGAVFASGSRVFVDGAVPGTVRASFPNGSQAFLFPHYVVEVEGRLAAIAFERVDLEERRVA